VKIKNFYLGDIVVKDPHTQHCSVVSLHRSYENLPINLWNVKTFCVGYEDFSLIPNFKVYKIIFTFVDEEYESWFFENEKDRDTEYNRLIELTCKETDHGEI